MASTAILRVLDATALTATTTTRSKSLSQSDDDFIAWLNVSANDGGTTVDVVLEHSPDGINFITFATFAQIANTTGTEAILGSSFAVANQPLFPSIRAVVTLGGTNSATVTVQLYFDSNKR